MRGVSAKDENIDMNFSGSGSRIAVGTGTSRKVYSVPLAESKGWWDKPIAGVLTQDSRSPSGEIENVAFPLISRVSQLNADLVSGRITGVILAEYRHHRRVPSRHRDHLPHLEYQSHPDDNAIRT
jgi:hypothetical protein